MRQSKDIDWQTRQLVKALEPTLRQHLGADGVERQFVAGLYGRLRQSLEDSGGIGFEPGEEKSGELQRLALDVYLTAATHLEGREVKPALLSAVRRAIEKAFTGPSR